MVKIDFNLSPAEQVDYILKKKLATKDEAMKLKGEAHHRAFTIAGVYKPAILRAVQEQIAKSMKDDLTFAEAKENILSNLRSKDKNFISDERLRFIFKQNMYSASGSVRCKKQMSSSLPYIQYLHTRSMGGALKKNYREKHWKAHGLIFKKDDPWLKKNMPPNGFRCNCSTRSISSYRLKKEGLLSVPQEVGKTEDVAEEGFDYNMCSKESEHIEKIENIEQKRALKGDEISKLALFENRYRRAQHFKKSCKNENEYCRMYDMLKKKINDEVSLFDQLEDILKLAYLSITEALGTL